MNSAAISQRTVANRRSKANLKRWVRMYFMCDLNYRRELIFQFQWGLGLRHQMSNKICSLDRNVQFYSFIHYSSYNLMALLQKVVNFVTILACTAFLVYLNSNINQLSTQQDELLELTSLIGHGVALSEQQLNKLATISASDSDQLKKNSPFCFLKAYQEVFAKGKINPQGIFNIFESGKELAGISTCNHYYSLLIFRASRLQSKEKVRIEAILNGLLGKQFQSKKSSKICIYHYGYNSEVIVKEQMGQIIHQEYTNFNAIIDVDGSNDNTHMFAKYMLEERKDKTHTIQLVTEPQRKGFIENFEKIIQKSCEDDSIVLFLNKHQVLLSPHSLTIVNNYFANTSNSIAVFKSLTIDHENIESNDVSKAPKIYPILALKKSQLTNINKTISKLSEDSKQSDLLTNYELELLIFSLLKQPQFLQKIDHSNDAIVYRQPRRQIQQQVLLNFFEKQ